MKLLHPKMTPGFLAFTLLAGTMATACAQLPEPNGGPIRAGTLPLTWATGGPKCMEMPEWQVHEYNPDLFILRQSGCTDYEKPFVFILFGKDRAILFDTGSRNGDIVPTLKLVLHDWMLRNHRTSMPLLVTHTHSHQDHIWGDAAIKAMNDPAIPVTYLAPTVAATEKFYNIAHWPEDIGQVDLGDRVIDVIPIPGHDVVSVAFYDRQTAILFTGDSVYPGRIYIHDFDAFAKSNERMVRFTEGKLVAHILGNHIEQTRTPYVDYPVGTIYQPNEHSQELSRGTLLEMQDAIDALHGKPRRVAYAEFSLWPTGPGFPDTPASADAYKHRQEYQKEHKWDQTVQQPPSPQ